MDSAAAQEGAGSAAPPTGASSAAGASEPTAPGAGPGSSSAFGTSPQGTGTATLPGAKIPAKAPGTGAAGTGTGPAGTGTTPNATGAASTFGEGGTGQRTPASEGPTFTIPGAYGRQAQQFTAGAGRLARPRFRYTGSVSFGYDDNVLQAPTDSVGVPDVVVEVLDDQGTPARLETGIGPNGEVLSVVVPGRAPTTKRMVIRGLPPSERIGSFLTRANVGFDVQFASRKTLFTFDLRTGADVYWDRPGKDTDYTGSIALLYLRRLTPRMQFTANVSGSYQTQPDLTQVNTSTRQTGAVLVMAAKGDLSYRVTPRITAVGSLSYNALRYQETTETANDYDQTTFGTELRYLFSPRLTLLGELRYSSVTYSSTPARDASSVFLLLGGELQLTRRFSATLRSGAAMRTFDESDVTSTSPYVETTLVYQLAKATLVQINGRFGFEEPQDENSELLSLRAGLNLVQSFSPRFRGTLGVNVVRQTTTSNLTDLETVADTVDSTIGFEYNLNRHWTLNANYTYITQFGTFSAADYYRNRLFVGAEYDF